MARLQSKFLIDVGIGRDKGRAGSGNATGPSCVNCYTQPMKRGTILIILGALIIAFIAAATYYIETFTLPMLLVALAGLITAGVGANQRWARTRP